jgi:hypothetical protein
MHSDPTLEILDKLTTQMGDGFRFFSAHVCVAYKTRELPREENARRRREAKNNKQSGDLVAKDSKKKEIGPKLKAYNANTYKHHALGDYVAHIREKGTTDSYSTEPVSPIASSLPIKAQPNRENWSIVPQRLGINAQTKKCSSSN